MAAAVGSFFRRYFLASPPILCNHTGSQGDKNAPKTKLPRFRYSERLISRRVFVALYGRLIAVSCGFWVATIIEVFFVKGWGT